jgi:hypothetical protein
MNTHHLNRVATWGWRALVGLGLTLFMASCASTNQVISGGRVVPVTRGAVAEMKVDKLWVQETDQGLVLNGYMLRSPGAPKGASGHVDVVQFDANGGIVEITHVPVSEWRKQPRLRSSLASFRVALDRLAESTARIEVIPQLGAHRS